MIGHMIVQQTCTRLITICTIISSSTKRPLANRLCFSWRIMGREWERKRVLVSIEWRGTIHFYILSSQNICATLGCMSKKTSFISNRQQISPSSNTEILIAANVDLHCATFRRRIEEKLQNTSHTIPVLYLSIYTF
ncbi:unnamed protein product [Cylicocyclus nassatus]|uniref:Uncharacterized protein n=1 Tax=Cylicocyclus nassatus TaxID=53992 RepID=A0AA36MDN8_CYLNA|nr:unnamed protein product [Cylicocyclus nassatus]